MPQTFPDPFRLLDQRRPIQERMRATHAQLQAMDPHIGRLAFAVYQPRNDLLSTYASHHNGKPDLSFYDTALSRLPSLQGLAQTRRCRVIDDMETELVRHSAHSRWLLEQGWRSSYTVPLFREEHLLGFLFLNSDQPALFTAALRQRLNPLLELLGAVLSQELTLTDSLRVAVQLALKLTGLRDPETGAHVERVSLYSRLIAMELQG